jgi:hypothetical protein
MEKLLVHIAKNHSWNRYLIWYIFFLYGRIIFEIFLKILISLFTNSDLHKINKKAHTSLSFSLVITNTPSVYFYLSFIIRFNVSI